MPLEEDLDEEDAIIRARKRPRLKGILRMCRGTTPDSCNADDTGFASPRCPGASSTDVVPQVFPDESKPQNLNFEEARIPKVHFDLPETFREEICDRDHPDHKSLRAVVIAKQIEKLEDRYQGRRKRMAEALSGFSLAGLFGEKVHWLLLQHASEIAQAQCQLVTQGYMATETSLRKAKAKAAAVAAAASHHAHPTGALWMTFLKSGLMFCPVKGLQSSVEGSANVSTSATSSSLAQSRANESAKSSVHAISSRAHQEAKAVHAQHVAALKAKTAAATAAAAVHCSIGPLGMILAGSCLLYTRNLREKRCCQNAKSVESDSAPNMQEDFNSN
jgi:hypothetical protein